MREIKIEKIVINIGCGEPGEKLERAKKILETITNKKAVFTSTKKRTTFGTPKGRTIGCKITLRKKDAENFLKNAFEAVEKKISKRIFDNQGNFSTGQRRTLLVPPDTASL